MSTYTCQIDNIGPFVINSYAFAPQHATASSDSGMAQVADVMVTKVLDANSPTLFQASANGTSFDVATITVTEDGGGSTVYKLASVIIASIQPGGNGTESMDLNFAHIEMDVTAAPSTNTSAIGDEAE